MTTTTAFDYRLRPRLAGRAALGLLALSTDATIEAEWRALLDLDGVEFYTGRVRAEAEVNPDNLRGMAARLGDSAASLLPGQRLDVIAYGCTSASMLIGEEAVAAALRAVHPQARVSTPITAAKTALGALGARRVALLTPYIDAINQSMREHLEGAGFAVPSMGSFLNGQDPQVVRIEPASIAAAARDLLAEQPVDALFIACTALRGAALVPALEDQLGVAATTSNHAMAWHALRLAGIGDALSGRGRLFGEPLPMPLDAG